jgi:adenylate cyclase
MFTDMVGSTSSAQDNEAEALRLRDEQADLVRPLFAAHQGREIKSMGDGFLSEFGSALRAVQCAIDIQQHLHERNSQPGTPPIQLRIGIHLGDVEQRESDIFGDAVNIASRIEPLATPGGVCISGEVFSQIRNKIPNTLQKLPPTSLKGIRVSIDVYRVLLPWNGRDASYEANGPAPLDTNRIAVLPFVSMSPDPNDEYFADGLTEELIANLALVKGLKVIARTSIMEYKKKEKHVSEIGKELGVGTIVEGSVRKAANRIRVTVQVIDVATEEHLWASKYDDNLDDVFAVQSDIATKVAASLPSNLAHTSAPAPTLLGARDMQAYLYFLQGQALLWKRQEEPIRQALRLFEQAVERDPTFSRAYASLAQAYKQLGEEGLISWSEAIVHGKAAAEKAVSIGPDLAEAHSILAEMMFMADDPFNSLEAEARRALELNPNLPEAHDILGQVAGVQGNIEASVHHIEEAYRLDPLSPPAIRYLGRAYFYAGRYAEAAEFWKRTLHLDPITAYNGLTEYYLAIGDLASAGEMVKEMERIAPTNRATYMKLGYLAAIQGDKVTALKMIAKLDAAHGEGWVNSAFAGYIYLALGDLDKFFDYMHAAVKSHTLPVTSLRYAPMLAAARKDPRFEQVISLDRLLNS